MVDEVQVQKGSPTGLSLPVDPEPASFRFALLAILVLGFIAGYVVSSNLFASGGCNLLSVFIGLGVGAGAMQLSETYLRPRWKSNKRLELSETSIDMVEGDKRHSLIDPTLHVNVYTWRFEVPRRTRVPKGWYVVALALEQDDAFFPTYTLVSPDAFSQMRMHESFMVLRKEKRQQDNMRLAGMNRRLLQAEAARTVEGLEMEKTHFESYIQWLQQTYPEWMPQS